MAVVLCPSAQAADPGRWTPTAVSSMPREYYQGVTSDPAGNFYFDGVWNGLYRTGSNLAETTRNARAIPRDVRRREGYNHIGDISWDAGEGGRLLLPIDCFPTRREALSNCKTTSIAVADPSTLSWRYYVKLDPAFATRVRWVAASPDGSLLWTSVGRDLIAYLMSDVSPANAGPHGRRLVPVKRLRGVRPPTPAITGGTFFGDRLLVAGNKRTSFQVWSIDLRGFRRLEIERSIVGESNGLDASYALGGSLHWQILPRNAEGRPPTYGAGHATLLSFSPTSRYGQPGRCSWIREGTAAADRIRGTGAGDRITGKAGRDLLRGLSEDDCLSGGPDRDRLNGGPGKDRLFGGGARDRLVGGLGGDKLQGDAGSDVLSGDDGPDRLSGGRGNDRLSGGRGSDRVFGGGGRDKLRGGRGRDRLVAGRGSDSIHAVDRRRDVVRCGPGRDRVRADRVDRLVGCERVRRTNAG